MSNNFFDDKSNAIKWILTFNLIAVLIIGMIASLTIGISNKKAINNAPNQPNSGMMVTPDETNSMVRLSVTPMASNSASQLSENSYTVNATILPASAMQQAVWSVAWKNPSSSWANGKTITQYVTITPSEENSLSATLSCAKGFSEQVILTVSAKANADKKATCTVDYKQRLIVSNLSLGGTALSTSTSNFNAKLGKMHMMEISYSYSDGTIPYLGKVGEFSEFICAGIAFSDEFIAAYNANKGLLPALTRKMKRANVSSEYAHTREFEFTDGAYGNTVFYGIMGYFSDSNMAVLRTAINTVGEGNVFKVGIFKTENGIDNGYVECDTWYKLGLQKDTVYMMTESITADNSGFVF